MRLAFLLLGLATSLPLAAQAGGATAVRIEPGSFEPLYSQPGDGRVEVEAFLLDDRPVSVAEFAGFVARQPRWQRDRVPGLFADRKYLATWATPTSPAISDPRERPVTGVSWFAAKAYCAARGGRLPRTAEWEYVARASETERDAAGTASFRQRALELALSSKGGAGRLRTGFRNAWGAWDMHGGVNEWVLDFNTNFAAADSRVTSSQDRGLTCAAGATAGGSSGDYAAFLRYALRGALEARSSAHNLGFRCAYDL